MDYLLITPGLGLLFTDSAVRGTRVEPSPVMAQGRWADFGRAVAFVSSQTDCVVGRLLLSLCLLQ